ncbi:MAG TPA: outer membrane protein assembly factor BamD, partial [Rhodothermales bacterium]
MTSIKRSIRWPRLLLVLLFAVSIAGCAGSSRLRYTGPQDAYQKGLSFYERGKYERAAEYLQAVFDFGRAHEWAADAQFLLAQAYYHNEEYILAASEFSRFSEIYRTDPR